MSGKVLLVVEQTNMKKIIKPIVCVICILLVGVVLFLFCYNPYSPANNTPEDVCSDYAKMIENEIGAYAMAGIFDTNIQVSIQDLFDSGRYDYIVDDNTEVEILTDLNKKFELVEGDNGLIINNFELELKYGDEVYSCTSSKCIKK